MRSRPAQGGGRGPSVGPGCILQPPSLLPTTGRKLPEWGRFPAAPCLPKRPPAPRRDGTSGEASPPRALGQPALPAGPSGLGNWALNRPRAPGLLSFPICKMGRLLHARPAGACEPSAGGLPVPGGSWGPGLGGRGPVSLWAWSPPHSWMLLLAPEAWSAVTGSQPQPPRAAPAPLSAARGSVLASLTRSCSGGA